MWSAPSVTVTFLATAVLFSAVVACGNNKKKGPPKFVTKEDPAADRDTDRDDDDKKTRNDDRKEPNTAAGKNGFLKSSDFTSGSSALSRERFQFHMSSLASSWSTFDAKTIRNAPDADECASKIKASKAKASAKNLAFDIADTKCTSYPSKRPATIKILARYSCSKDAFAKLDGKRYDAVAENPTAPLCASSKMSFLTNYAKQVREETGEFKGYTSAMKVAISKSDGSPCEVDVTKSTFKYGSSCSYFYASDSRWPSGSSEKVSFKGQYKNAEGEFDNPYFTSGSMDFTLNNWKGTITYSSSGREFTATSDKGERASGSLK